MERARSAVAEIDAYGFDAVGRLAAAYNDCWVEHARVVDPLMRHDQQQVRSDCDIATVANMLARAEAVLHAAAVQGHAAAQEGYVDLLITRTFVSSNQLQMYDITATDPATQAAVQQIRAAMAASRSQLAAFVRGLAQPSERLADVLATTSQLLDSGQANEAPDRQP